MNYTLETAGRSQLLIWKAETGWLTSLYEKNISACSNNPGQINLIEANCLLRCNPNESCSSCISFCFRPKIQKLSSRFHKSELCWENKKEDAVWKLPKMDKLIKSFCLVVIHKLIISMVLYGVYIVVIQLQAQLPWWMVGSASEPKGNWPLESHGINLGLGRNAFCSLGFPKPFLPDVYSWAHMIAIMPLLCSLLIHHWKR